MVGHRISVVADLLGKCVALLQNRWIWKFIIKVLHPSKARCRLLVAFSERGKSFLMQLSYARINVFLLMEALIKAIKASVPFGREGNVVLLIFQPWYLLGI